MILSRRKWSISNRAVTKRIVDASQEWRKARDIAAASEMTYFQTLYALNSLLKTGDVLRLGSKKSASWGPAPKPHERSLPTHELHAFFHAFVRGKPKEDHQ